ncbi:mycofactocin radical SAM maturase MftC, putative [Babesia caballi]|uniref:Mycofactocin radical SAM maturase MftC, putative n=1 Tax=Babesia caballi TaxID=5871 RepID=A0AAV4LVN8_BABCB|nr:mycofactocin radical SAM maturase MftC, putative [Babesia caballi]
MLQSLSPGAIFGVKLSNNAVQLSIMTSPNFFLTPLQHPYRKRNRRIAQPMRRHVGRRDASACNFRSAVTTTIIPNELPKPVGQVDNKFPTIQCLLNLRNFRTSPGCRLFNFFKKLPNLLGKF